MLISRSWVFEWGVHSHFRVQPNYSVEVVFCCVVVGVVTIDADLEDETKTMYWYSSQRQKWDYLFKLLILILLSLSLLPVITTQRSKYLFRNPFNFSEENASITRLFIFSQLAECFSNLSHKMVSSFRMRKLKQTFKLFIAFCFQLKSYTDFQMKTKDVLA